MAILAPNYSPNALESEGAKVRFPLPFVQVAWPAKRKQVVPPDTLISRDEGG